MTQEELDRIWNRIDRIRKAIKAGKSVTVIVTEP